VLQSSYQVNCAALPPRGLLYRNFETWLRQQPGFLLLSIRYFASEVASLLLLQFSSPLYRLHSSHRSSLAERSRYHPRTFACRTFSARTVQPRSGYHPIAALRPPASPKATCVCAVLILIAHKSAAPPALAFISRIARLAGRFHLPNISTV